MDIPPHLVSSMCLYIYIVLISCVFDLFCTSCQLVPLAYPTVLLCVYRWFLHKLLIGFTFIVKQFHRYLVIFFFFYFIFVCFAVFPSCFTKILEVRTVSKLIIVFVVIVVAAAVGGDDGAVIIISFAKKSTILYRYASPFWIIECIENSNTHQSITMLGTQVKT